MKYQAKNKFRATEFRKWDLSRDGMPQAGSGSAHNNKRKCDVEGWFVRDRNGLGVRPRSRDGRLAQVARASSSIIPTARLKSKRPPTSAARRAKVVV
jgi:hypothetical protein